MRQRLSSEPDRYRGRRRVPTPPRSRYAVVGRRRLRRRRRRRARRRLQPPGRQGRRPDGPARPREAPATDRRHRRPRRPTPSAPTAQRPRRRRHREAQRRAGRGRGLAAARCDDYTFTSPYGIRFGQAARRHRPGRRRGHAVQGGPRRRGDRRPATTAGTATRSPSSTTTAPRSSTRHSRRLLVQEGDKVKAGQVDRRGRQHRLLVRHAPAHRDPRQRRADRPDPAAPRARRRHQAQDRIGVRQPRRFLIAAPPAAVQQVFITTLNVTCPPQRPLLAVQQPSAKAARVPAGLTPNGLLLVVQRP